MVSFKFDDHHAALFYTSTIYPSVPKGSPKVPNRHYYANLRLTNAQPISCLHVHRKEILDLEIQFRDPTPRATTVNFRSYTLRIPAGTTAFPIDQIGLFVATRTYGDLNFSSDFSDEIHAVLSSTYKRPIVPVQTMQEKQTILAQVEHAIRNHEPFPGLYLDEYKFRSYLDELAKQPYVTNDVFTRSKVQDCFVMLVPLIQSLILYDPWTKPIVEYQDLTYQKNYERTLHQVLQTSNYIIPRQGDVLEEIRIESSDLLDLPDSIVASLRIGNQPEGIPLIFENGVAKVVPPLLMIQVQYMTFRICDIDPKYKVSCVVGILGELMQHFRDGPVLPFQTDEHHVQIYHGGMFVVEDQRAKKHWNYTIPGQRSSYTYTNHAIEPQTRIPLLTLKPQELKSLTMKFRPRLEEDTRFVFTRTYTTKPTVQIVLNVKKYTDELDLQCYGFLVLSDPDDTNSTLQVETEFPGTVVLDSTCELSMEDVVALPDIQDIRDVQPL